MVDLISPFLLAVSNMIVPNIKLRKKLKFYNIPAKRSANVRARCPFCPLNNWLVFLDDGLFLNILSIENDDAESIR